MQTEKKEPRVLPSGEGRKLLLTGHELTLKLTSRETGGESYVYEVVTPAGVGMPLHVHRTEDEIIDRGPARIGPDHGIPIELAGHRPATRPERSQKT